STSSLFGRSTVATRAAVAVTLPVPPAGGFDYQLYVGPLEFRRLSQLGHDLDDANPYGGFLQPIIQPVSMLVVNIMIWIHDRLPPDAPADAGVVRAVLRVREHDRVSRRPVPLASRPVARRPLLHHPHRDGALDVRALEGRADRDAAEPADEDDAVLHAGVLDAPVPELRLGAEPVLRREQHFQHPATVFDRAAPAAGAGEANLTARREAGGEMRAV